MRQCVFGILSLLLLQAQTCAPIPAPPDEFASFQDEAFEPEASLSVEEVTGEPETVRYRLTVTIVGAGTLYEYDAEMKAQRNLYEFYDAGDTAKPTAWADPGYVFSHWKGDATAGTVAYIEIVMDSDKAIIAVFVEAAQLKMDVVGEGNMDLPSLLHFTIGSESVGFGDRYGYAVGSEVTVAAVPDAGWRFVRWEKRSGVLFGATVEWDAVDETTTDAVLTMVWGGPTKLTVVFEEDVTPIYTQQEVADFFDVSSFNIWKWQTEIRIAIFGSPTNEDVATVNASIVEVNSIMESAGSPVRLRIDGSNPNFEVHFAPLEGFLNGVTAAGFATTEGQPALNKAVVYIESTAWDGQGVRPTRMFDGGKLFALTQTERNTVTRHEMMHGFGFQHSTNPNSVMSSSWFIGEQSFPDIDRKSIEILYQPRLLAGMLEDEARKALDPLVIGRTGSISARVLPSVMAEGGFCGCSQ